MPRVSENIETSHTPHRDDGRAQMNAEFEDCQRGKPLKALIGLGILVVVALVLARIDHDPRGMAPPPSAVTDPGAHSTTAGQAPQAHAPPGT